MIQGPKVEQVSRKEEETDLLCELEKLKHFCCVKLYLLWNRERNESVTVLKQDKQDSDGQHKAGYWHKFK